MYHQYVERYTSRVLTERLMADGIIETLYGDAREKAPFLFKLLTSPRASALLCCFNYDMPFLNGVGSSGRILRKLGIDLSECLERGGLRTARQIFERKIRYWQCRPMPDDDKAVVSPADAKILVGSFSKQSLLFLKEKFFHYEELLGNFKPGWIEAFRNGDWAICRLTPEKYHYNHVPVAGKVIDIYEIEGAFHSCNPSAVVAMATPFSKNRRVVTVIDTNVPGGTGIGLVAMIEIVALMIGDIRQCYSRYRYEKPEPVVCGMFLKKGQPKSLYRPGSSMDVVIFRKGKVRFCRDILHNLRRPGVSSRFCEGFNKPLVETDVMVRSAIGHAI